MSHITRMHALRTTILASALALASVASWAARDFTPQAGTWVISEEVDGNPGRGLAIDVQGNTFIMQVYGYEQNGDATFYTAVGHMQGDTVTAPLVRYTGGRSFGSEARDGMEDKDLGDVTLHFRNGLQGTIALPGEPERGIERFIFAGRDDPHYQTESWQGVTRLARWLGLNEQGQVVNAWRAMLQWSATDPMQLSLSNESNWSNLECTRPAQTQSIHCIAVSETGSPVVKEAEFRLVGAQVTGTITLQAEGAAPLRLQGVNTEAFFPPGAVILGGCCSRGIETYGQGSVPYGQQPSYMPSNGTWVMNDELTGKPGRGISLDVQGGKMVMQVFGYQANGQPTFHMGVGSYAAESEYSDTSSTLFGLQQYGGGRSVGGAPASAHLVHDAGNVLVSVSGARSATLAQAMVQLPGEEAKLMQRIPLESPQSLEDRFFGEWYAPSFGKLGGPLTVTLNRMDGDVARNEEGSVRCQLDAETQRARCLFNRSTDGVYDIDFSDEFVMSHNFVRVRDRHGNLTGLGNVPLD